MDDLHEIKDVDRLIHEPTRYLLMAHLYVVKEADFVFLARKVGLTGGNLSSHMSKLEDAEYVRVDKAFVNKRPQTTFRLTRKGRSAFEMYRQTMEKVLNWSKSHD